MSSRRTFLEQLAAGSMLAAVGLPQGWTQPVASRFSINVFSKHLQYLDFPEMARVIKEIGFDGADLTVRPGGHIEPKDAAKELPRAAEAFAKAGVKLDMMTTNLTDASAPLTETVLKAAAAIGIKTYRMGSLKYQKDQPLPAQIEAMREGFKPLAEMNRRYDIKGAYQNHSGPRVGGPVWDLHLLLNELDPEYLGVQYDIRHATVEGGQSWPLGLELMRPLIHSLDIKDFLWTRPDQQWKVTNVPLGQGMVDWDAYLAKLKAYDISVPISIHYEYPLGGADHGKRELTIPREQVYAAMHQDLVWFKEKLKTAGLAKK